MLPWKRVPLQATATFPSGDIARSSIIDVCRSREVPNRNVAPAGSGLSATKFAAGAGAAGAGAAGRGCTGFVPLPDGEAPTHPARPTARTQPATITAGRRARGVVVEARSATAAGTV